MKQIFPELYQFTIHIEQMHFTIHQYLFLANDPILISTGTVQQSEKILPEIKKLLNGNDLKYIFVSHMESDECGGLNLFLKEFPNVITVCSELSSRELPGYGFTGKIIKQKNNEVLNGNGFSILFIEYPSEVHLQNGLIFYEEKRKILFSSDLMLSFGDAVGEIKESKWEKEVESINIERIPNKEMLKKLAIELNKISPKFIAVGHGYCIKCNE